MLGKQLTKMLPYFAKGIVVRGFGRGSKDLGFPTANLSDDVIEALPPEFASGVYFGWASVDDGPVKLMVMSVGYNPFFNNTKRTMETHILDKFDLNFYSKIMKVCIAGHIRPEKNFASLDELKSAINADIAFAKAESEKPEFQKLSHDKFFIATS